MTDFRANGRVNQKRIKESTMTPTGKPYPQNQTDKDYRSFRFARAFIILDKNDKPMLAKGGIIITDGDDGRQVQERANDLYRMIPNAKSIYIIENEDYDKCVNIRSEKEYVEFVKKTGELVKDTSKEPEMKTSDIEDSDFLIDVDAYWQDFGVKESLRPIHKKVKEELKLTKDGLPYGFSNALKHYMIGFNSGRFGADKDISFKESRDIIKDKVKEYKDLIAQNPIKALEQLDKELDDFQAKQNEALKNEDSYSYNLYGSCYHGLNLVRLALTSALRGQGETY